MPNARSWKNSAAAAAVLALLGPVGATAQTAPKAEKAPLSPCSGTQREQWHECTGAFEDRRSGLHYSGEFRRGAMDGVGILRTPITVYAGDFREGRMHGQGVLHMLDDQRKYVGGFRQGVMHGPGSIFGADGKLLLSGWFQDGVMSADAPGAGGAVMLAPAGGSGGQRAGLGAKLGEPGPGRPAGAMIVDVTTGSAARRGGLAPGDVVVGLGGGRSRVRPNSRRRSRRSSRTASS